MKDIWVTNTDKTEKMGKAMEQACLILFYLKFQNKSFLITIIYFYIFYTDGFNLLRILST